MKLLPLNLKEQTALGESGLMHAIKHKKLNYAKRLLQSARLQDTQGRTALMFAADSDYIEGVQLLLDFESNILDNNKQPALIYAVKKGNLASFQLIFKYEFQFIQQSQLIALKYKQFSIVNEIAEILQDKYNYIATIDGSQTYDEFLIDKVKQIQEDIEINDLEKLLQRNDFEVNTSTQQESNQNTQHDFIYINAQKLINLSSQIQLMQENLFQQKEEEIDNYKQQLQDLNNYIQNQENANKEDLKKIQKLYIQVKNLEKDKIQLQKENKQLQNQNIKQQNSYVQLEQTMTKEVNKQIFLQQKLQKEMKLKDQNQSLIIQSQFQQNNEQISQLRSQFQNDENKYRLQIQNQANFIKGLQKDLISCQNQLEEYKQFQQQRIQNLEATNTALKASLIKLQQEINEFNEQEKKRIEMSNRPVNLMMASLRGTQYNGEKQKSSNEDVSDIEDNNEQQQQVELSNEELFKILYQRCPTNLVNAIQILENKMK